MPVCGEFEIVETNAKSQTMYRSMGGTTTTNRAGVRGRAIVCTQDVDLDQRLRVGLAEAGFDTHSTSSLRGSLGDDDGAWTVVLVDDGSPDWLRDVSDLMRRQPELRPIVLTTDEHVDECLAAITAGVAGFCRRDASTEAILRTVSSVIESGVAIPRSMMGPLVDHVRHGRGRRVQSAAGPIEVTDREWEILQLMMQRRSTKDMAEALFVSVGTVRSHVSALLHKLGAVDRDDAVAMIERARRS